MPQRSSAVIATWTAGLTGDASRCSCAMSGAGGKTGIHATTKRTIKERNFISFTSTGTSFDALT
jgi:hypothetical protein